MKKLSAFIIILLVCTVALSGCGGSMFGCDSGPTQVVNASKNAPWYSARYEKITYDINRYQLNADGTPSGGAVGTGTYVTTIEVVKNISDYASVFPIASLELNTTAEAYTVLTTSYTLNEGSKTDTVTSSLLMYTSDLMPIYMVKEGDWQTSGDKVTVSANYKSRKNEVTINGEKSETETVNNCYDSEMVYYIVRALSTLTAGSSGTLSVFSTIDAAVNKTSNSTPMSISTASEYFTMPVDKEDKFIKKCYRSLPEKNDEGYYKINCKRTALGITDANQRGATTALYFANDVFDILGAEMSNVLIRIDIPEFDTYATDKLTQTHTTSFTISDYSVVKE